MAVSFKEYTIDAKSKIYKPSFNCNNARTKIEHVICHSKELAYADVVLSTLYYRLVDKQPVDFVTRQKMWLRERDFCSYSIDIERCLLNKYQDRILQLKHLKIIVPSKNIRVEQHEQWDHPVLPILQKHNISLYKVSYSNDGTCPTFYVKFKYHPLSAENDKYSKKVYAEILHANSSFPYAIVDKDHNFKVNVGFRNKAKTINIVRSAGGSSPSTCLDGSSSPDAEKFTVIAQMKKQILRSPFKTPLRQEDGKKIIAYLYAADEKAVSYDYTGCTTGIKLRAKAKTGHYYIYLYDVITDYFYPSRVPVFNGDKPTIMGIEGAYFVTVSGKKANRPDTLVVSQRDTCQESFYEAYTLWEDHTSLQKLTSFHHYSALEFYLQGNKKDAA
ncbi:MAG: lysozyme inhibitor LprI family protein [Legionella sp.]|uniref:lysozyme inhibitor LprI family protein n=1 Tax=Legionella sp. TaxID=459 RepID=UPI0039E3B6FA